MADPIFGSKYGPQNGVQNWITFSFLLLGLCLGPVLGSRFGPKSGVSHRRILLLPAEVLQADLRRTSMSVSVNICFLSLVFLVQKQPDLGRTKRKRYELTFMFKLQGRKSACTTCAGSSEILRRLTPFFGPNMDPKWGPELDHIFIPSFRPLLGPRFGFKH